MTSPAAKMCGAVVRRYGSTSTKPRASISSARRREIQLGRVRLPADGHDRERRFRAVAIAVLLVVHTHAAWRFLERFDLAEVFTNGDPAAAKRGGDGRRNIFIFRRQNARAAMEELHSRAKRVEDRSHLRPGRAAANHQHRCRHGGQAPGIAVRVRELESGDVEPPTDSARAKDEFLRPQPQPGRRFDCLWIDESRNAGVFVHGHAQRIDLFAPCGMSTHIFDDLADAREQPRIVQHRLAHRNAVLSELSRLADQPRCVSQRSYGNRSVIGRHAAELVSCDQRRASAQVRSAQCRDHPGRSRTNDDDVDHVPFIHIPYLKS